MKKALTIIFLFVLNYSYAQLHFQRFFNLSNNAVDVRHEVFHDGIRTRNNADANNAFYYVSIGSSQRNAALPAPHNVATQLRFARLNRTASQALNNWGYHYFWQGRALNSVGYSIAEIPNATNNGGYLAVGEVINNSVTGAVVPGGGDILLTRLTATGSVSGARKIDLTGGRDRAWSIKRSVTQVSGQPTWLICGFSRQRTYVDAFVARINVNGGVIWVRRYNFDPGRGNFNTADNFARDLTEDAAGNIYVVGNQRDHGSNRGVDGLAFKLTSGGAVLWAATYHHHTDDQFQAVRLTPDGHLIVGGFTNAGGTYNMQIAKLNALNGNILFRNILRATHSDGVTYPSKAFDILVAPGPRYYLAGALHNFPGANLWEILYQADAAGKAVRWISIGPNATETAHSIDYVPGPCAGIAYFASRIDNVGPQNVLISFGHIIKTGLDTRTCGVNPPRTGLNTPSLLAKIARPNTVRFGFTSAPLVSSRFAYASREICRTNCRSVASAEAEEVLSEKARVAEAEATAPTAEKARLYIKPNPVTDHLNIAAQGFKAGAYQVQVFNMAGKLVQDRSLHASQDNIATSLDLSGLAPGVYMVVVRQDALVLKQRVVKQ